MSMNKAKKVLALLLAVVMCASLFTTFAFAERGAGDIPAGGGRKPTNYNIVCIGDEYANGKGLNSYGDKDASWIDLNNNGKEDDGETFDIKNTSDVGAMNACADQSYVKMLGDTLQTVLGSGFKVMTTSLCFNGMRAEDLRYLLEREGGDHYFKIVNEGYNAWFEANKDDLNDSNGKLKEGWDALSPLNKLVNADKEPYHTLGDFMIDKIKNASLITYDLGMNNFGTYLLNRIETALAWAQPKENTPANTEWNNHFKITDNEGKTKIEPIYSKESGYPYADQDAEALHGELVPGTEHMMRILVTNSLKEFANIAPDSLAKELADAFMYTFFNYCISFEKDIAYLRFLAPLSQIIVVGNMNSLKSMRLSIPYSEKEDGTTTTMDFDLGSFWQSYLTAVETFITNSQVGTQFKFAPIVTAKTDVETLFDVLVKDATAKGDDGFADFAETQYAKTMFAELRPVVVDLFAAKAGSEEAAEFVYGLEEFISGFEANKDAKAYQLAIANTLPQLNNKLIAALSKDPINEKNVKNIKSAIEYLNAVDLQKQIDQATLALVKQVYDSAIIVSDSDEDNDAKPDYDPYVFPAEALDMTKLQEKLKTGAIDENTKHVLALYANLLAGTGSFEAFLGGNVQPNTICLSPIGTLPSADGHKAKLAAIMKAWVLPGNADTTAEDVTFGFFENILGGFANSFQVPLLDAINQAFLTIVDKSVDFFQNFFKAIMQGINLILPFGNK